MSHDCGFLREVVPEDRLSFNDSTREEHAAGWAAKENGTGVTPDVVVWPESTEEVAAVLSAANDRGVPVTPYAAGTSLEGNAVPSFEGISMDMTRMDAIVDVRPDDLQIDVEPGVLGSAIDDAAKGHGLFFPPLPSSGDISTIGGMIANDASGMQTVKYGEISDWVLEIEAVLADGSIITSGSKAVKSSSGYNLRDLLVGSEGTLGVITRATLELAGLPEQFRGGRAIFPTLDDATEAVSDVVRSGVDVAKIEFIDPLSAKMANQYTGSDLPNSPMTFLEFHADHGVEDEIDFCQSIFESHDVRQFEMSDDDTEMETLWTARRELAYAARTYDPNLKPLHPGDITVPISKYSDIIRYAKDLATEHDLALFCFGHGGDGNVHYSPLVNPNDPEMVARGHTVYDEIIEQAIEMGGTATGEHGIGQGKRKYMALEHGEESVEAMRTVKRALDPRDTLNPGKIFPETIERDGRVNVGLED
ncbi:FAD-binding oxidoreductase [Natrinema sp. CGMCC1.2065]|uniref:FAD-binding oxidoreductase n=1 Tax=Natrinema sp. CGMCC1.2065 TaxID=3445767 RepID=UPI003F4A4E49